MLDVRSHGEGTVYQEKTTGRWVASVSTPTGRRKRYVPKREAPTEKVGRKRAEKLLGKMLDELAAGLDPKAARLTVEGLLSGWLADVIQVRPATERHYRMIADGHLIPALGTVLVADLTPLQVQRYLNAKGATHAPQTVRHHHAVLRNALGYAVRAGYVGRNVASLASPPVAVRSRGTTLGNDALGRVSDSGDRLVALWLLAGIHGLRESEALGLLWEDVDLVAGTVDVRHQLARSLGRWVLVEPKTERSRRTVHLAPIVKAALAAHRERMLAEAARASDWPFYKHVFLTPAGRPYHSAKLLDTWYALLDRLDLQRVTFHQLRHSAATNALAAGATLEDVKQMLGHSSIRLTSDTYSHPDEGRAREVAKLLGEGFQNRSALRTALTDPDRE